MVVDIVLIDIWVERSSFRTTHGIVLLGVNRPSLNYHKSIFKTVIHSELEKNVNHSIQLLLIPDILCSRLSNLFRQECSVHFLGEVGLGLIRVPLFVWP